jgi:hypothetical protein
MIRASSDPLADLRAYSRQVIWQELGFISLMVMEFIWLLPWFRSLTPGIQQQASTADHFLFLVFLIIVAYANRLIRLYEIKPALQRAILILLLLIGLYFFARVFVYPSSGLSPGQMLTRTMESISEIIIRIPEIFLVILMGIYLWWRGIRATVSAGLQLRPTERKFRLGILALAAHGIIFRGMDMSFLLHAIPIYFISGIFAVALSRTSNLLHGGIAHRLPFTGRWFLGLVLISSITICLGVLLGAFLRSSSMAAILGFLKTLLEFILPLLEAILRPVIFAIVAIIEVIVNLVRPLVNLERLEKLLEQLQSRPEVQYPLDEGRAPFHMPPAVVAAIVFVLLAVIVTLVLRKSKSRFKGSLQPFPEVGEDVQRSKDFLSKMRKTLDQLLGRLEELRQSAFGHRIRAATIIRQIYVDLLMLAAELGRPRDASETPLEYQQQLNALFPNQKEHINEITQAYVQVRYGEFPEEKSVVSTVQVAWATIQKAALRRK